ncbi:unnamed protein product [Adineta steineri]|uniref:Uncharacterized protein n=1 Tax=Adineta steineri TaxID=433720 RepID=A0A814D4J0_9BILA|nr:unnamed protein product [Adineta steineri]CAF0955824.1 unnamed protein product [Adineta steineri]CAF0960830.1 unnamed protein product [Adineta steineri]
MSEPGVLHRSAEIEDLTHLTEQDKKNIEQEAQKGSDHLQSDQHNYLTTLTNKTNETSQKPLQKSASAIKDDAIIISKSISKQFSSF